MDEEFLLALLSGMNGGERREPSLLDRLRMFLEPESGAGLAALIGASAVPGVGEAIDVADFIEGARTRDPGRMGMAALGAAVPFISGPQLRALLEIGGSNPRNPFFQSFAEEVTHAARQGRSLLEELGVMRLLDEMNLGEEAARNVRGELTLAERMAQLPARNEPPADEGHRQALMEFVRRTTGRTTDRRASGSVPVMGGRRAGDPEASVLMDESRREALLGLARRAQERVRSGADVTHNPLAELARLLGSGGGS